MQIEIDSIYKECLDSYWDDNSAGKVDIQSVWPKYNGNYTWTTNRTLNEWKSMNGDSLKGLWWKLWDSITTDVVQKMALSQPNIFDSISALHFIMIETPDLLKGGSSWAPASPVKYYSVNGSPIWDGPVTVNSWADAIPHEATHNLGFMWWWQSNYNYYINQDR